MKFTHDNMQGFSVSLEEAVRHVTWERSDSGKLEELQSQVEQLTKLVTALARRSLNSQKLLTDWLNDVSWNAWRREEE